MNETTGDLGPPPPTPEEAAMIRGRRRNRFYKVVGIWLILCVGLIVEKIVNLGSVEGGLRDGFMTSAFTAPFMMPVAVILGVVGSLIGSLKPLRRFRLLLTFALPALPILVIVGDALYGRYFPEKKFERLTGVELPRDARMDRYVLDTGWSPVHDTSCTFEITCPVEQTDQLLDAMKMKKDPVVQAVSPAGTGWFVDESWSRSQKRGEDEIPTEFLNADMDASRTKLRVIWSTI